MGRGHQNLKNMKYRPAVRVYVPVFNIRWSKSTRIHFLSLLQMNVELNWEEFAPVSGSLITLPENVHFWRGYSLNYPILSERPTYFGSKKVAFGYAELDTNLPRELGCFKTTRPIRLLDYRYMKSLLSHIFQLSQPKDLIVMATIYAFGICSFYHQMQLAKHYFRMTHEHVGIQKMFEYYNSFSSKFIELEGVRIAETDNDGQVVVFLSELFKDLCDGFITPRIQTPYYHEKNGWMPEEIILFNPIKSGIVKTIAPTALTPKPISDYIRKLHREVIIEYDLKKLPVFISSQVSGSEPPKDHPLNVFNELLDKNDSNTVKIAKDAQACGKRIRGCVHYQYAEAPHPQISIRNWNEPDTADSMKRRSISPLPLRRRSRRRQ